MVEAQFGTTLIRCSHCNKPIGVSGSLTKSGSINENEELNLPLCNECLNKQNAGTESR